MYKKYLELLEKTGETTYQVAKETGIRQTTLSDWGVRQRTYDAQGNGKVAGLSIVNLNKLANHFGVPLAYFVEEEVS